MRRHIVISDIHLGSGVCRARKFKEFLSEIHEGKIPTDEIIVNGDLFDSLDFRRLKSSHWKILSKMRQIAKSKRVIWIRGNHDGPAEVISHLIGIDFLDEYLLESGDMKVLIFHGDIFDDFISEYPLLTKLADLLYRAIQKIYGGSRLAFLAKRSSKTFLRCSENVKKRAKIYAQSKHANAVCCGHTHLAESDLEGDVKYHNSGCWTEEDCHYISICGNDISIFNFTYSNSSAS